MTTPATITRPMGHPSPPAGAVGVGAAHTPPAWLPGEHFAAALFFFFGGAVGLVVIAPDLARGAFFLPHVVAVVHLLVLGWIVLSIFGALCQFLPVAVGRPIRWEGLAHLSFAAQTVGVSFFVGGLLVSSRGLLLGGATLLAIAFFSFGLNVGVTLASVRERSLTYWALAGSTVFLVITPVYGVLLALNLHGDIILANRFELIVAHAHVAVVGFVLLVMVGVAHRLLPMFLLSHGANERAGWISVLLLASGAACLAVPFGGGVRWILAGGLTAGGVVAFLVQAHAFIRHRKRRAIDPGVRLAAIGLVGLGAALLVAPFALTKGVSEPRLLTAYFMILIGGISLFVAGHYYKIIPFLVWFHRFGPLIGKQPVPKVADLWPERVAFASLLLLTAGWVGLVASTYVGAESLARISAISFLLGAVVEVFVISKVVRRRPV